MNYLEAYSNYKVPPNCWIILRLDGRAFHGVTEYCEKPYDIHLRDAMVSTAQELLREFDGLYAYVQSDEISVLLHRSWNLFDRRLEKIVSVFSGLASSKFSFHWLQQRDSLGLEGVDYPHFDARVCLAVLDEEVANYFKWRMDDAWRNCVQAWAYWTLRNNGYSKGKATSKLLSMTVKQENDMLFSEFGINVSELPEWQRKGNGLIWECYEKDGYNPKTEQTVVCQRRRIVEMLLMPYAYNFIYQIMKSCGKNK